MAHERSVDATFAVKLFFEREDDQRLVDVVADQPDASLPPRPELGRDVIHGWNAALLHLPGHSPVERGGVDDNGEVRLAAVGLFNQVPIKSEDFRKMAENLGDTDDGEIFGVDHGFVARGAHAVATDTEKS